ncbi:MAG: hypothetical protein WB760_04575 [Xanthobacteraceae bacterium]
MLVVHEPVVEIRSFAIFEMGGFLLILLRHLPQDTGDFRGPGYTRLPHANAREFNQISKRTHLPSRRLLGSIANLCIGVSQNWDNLLFHKEKSLLPDLI